jgi:hypothetical protein
MRLNQEIFVSLLIASVVALCSPVVSAQTAPEMTVYDEAAYTEYVATTMQKLDKLYLEFCASCGADATKAGEARQEFLVTVRDLMQYMNGRFDQLDPKMGAALSPTETLVSMHALTMLVDILTAIQIESMTPHPYVN